MRILLRGEGASPLLRRVQRNLVSPSPCDGRHPAKETCSQVAPDKPLFGHNSNKEPLPSRGFARDGELFSSNTLALRPVQRRPIAPARDEIQYLHESSKPFALTDSTISVTSFVVGILFRHVTIRTTLTDCYGS